MAPPSRFWEQVEARLLKIADMICVLISLVGLGFTGWSHFGGFAMYHMVPRPLFWVITSINVLGGPTGVALSYAWIRKKYWDTGSKIVMTFIFSTLLTAAVCCAILLATVYRTGYLPQSRLGNVVLSESLMAVSVCFPFSLLLRTDVPEYFWKRTKGLHRTQAKLLVVNDFATTSPGECAICLDKLCNLDPELAQKPCKGSNLSGKGLLRLPCGHTFHGACAEGWFSRHDTCPLCRCKDLHIGKCTRLCAKPNASVTRSVVIKSEDNDVIVWSV
jgi:hypothetical protein